MTEQDYLNKEKFGDVDSYKRHRAKDISMPSLSQSREYLNNRKNESNVKDTHRAYKLLKRDEELKKKNNDFWAELQLLKKLKKYNIYMIKFLGLFVFLTLLGYLYDRYKFKYEGDEELNRYEKMKEYLLNDSASGLMAKPILWIHNDKEINSRKWLSFGSRNSVRTNLDYLTTCLESIVKKNGDYFNICLIDDTSFEKLIPNWNVKLHKLSNPVKKYIRTLALTKVLNYYGGMLVPNSLILKKPLKDMYDSGISKTGMFSVEYHNRTNTQITLSYFHQQILWVVKKTIRL